MNIGQRIKERRKELKMSADELGKRLGKDRSTIYRYENGDIENMPLDILPELANALETTQQYLMNWEETQKNNDTAADIVDKLLDNPSIYPLVDRLLGDSEFLSLVESLNNLDSKKIKGVSQMLNSFQ